MIPQQPSELPQPKPSPPEQQFGEYTLEYFIRDNWLYLCGILLILFILLVYSWWLRKKRSEQKKD